MTQLTLSARKDGSATIELDDLGVGLVMELEPGDTFDIIDKILTARGCGGCAAPLAEPLYLRDGDVWHAACYTGAPRQEAAKPRLHVVNVDAVTLASAIRGLEDHARGGTLYDWDVCPCCDEETEDDTKPADHKADCAYLRLCLIAGIEPIRVGEQRGTE